MKILIIEDVQEKRDAVAACITETLLNDRNSTEILYAACLIEAIRQINKHKLDLIVFDMFLPNSNNDTTVTNCSQELITEFSQSSNYQSEAIALTAVDIN